MPKPAPRPIHLLIPAAVGLLLATTAAAQGGSPCAPVSTGPEQLVIAGGSSPDAALFADGSGVVVWVDDGDGSRNGIRARFVDASARAVGDAFFVNTVTDQDQFAPSVAAAPDGRFVVVWESDVSPQDGDGQSVRARVYGANGQPVGPDFQVNTLTAGDQEDPKVAMAANGDFVVVWTSDSSGGNDQDSTSIQARRFAASGAPLGAQLQVNDYVVRGQTNPDVGMAPDGRFVAVWTSSGSPGDDGSGFSIQARVFTAGGAAAAGQFQVNTRTAQSQDSPAVAVDPDGSFLVVWESDGSDESDDDRRSIHARGYLPNGAAVGNQRQVNERIVGSQTGPLVAPVGGREFLVVWSSSENPLNQTAQARAVTLETELLGFEFNVGESGNTSAADPGVGGNGAGDSIALAQINGGNNDLVALDYQHPCALGGGVTTCTENATTLCLTRDRFRVTAVWRNSQGNSGDGQAIELTPDTGYFWFFDSANVETVVKVLDACGVNGRFWVFIGGLTDLGIEFVVEDVEAGEFRRYANPLGQPFATINDTAAFDTCP